MQLTHIFSLILNKINLKIQAYEHRVIYPLKKHAVANFNCTILF